MTPIPGIPVVLEPGQTKLDFSGKSKPKRPGKVSNPATKILVWRSSGIRREFSGESVHETLLMRQFDDACVV
jgi:hypothetical protein